MKVKNQTVINSLLLALLISTCQIEGAEDVDNDDAGWIVVENKKQKGRKNLNPVETQPAPNALTAANEIMNKQTDEKTSKGSNANSGSPVNRNQQGSNSRGQGNELKSVVTKVNERKKQQATVSNLPVNNKATVTQNQPQHPQQQNPPPQDQQNPTEVANPATMVTQKKLSFADIVKKSASPTEQQQSSKRSTTNAPSTVVYFPSNTTEPLTTGKNKTANSTAASIIEPQSEDVAKLNESGQQNNPATIEAPAQTDEHQDKNDESTSSGTGDKKEEHAASSNEITNEAQILAADQQPAANLASEPKSSDIAPATEVQQQQSINEPNTAPSALQQDIDTASVNSGPEDRQSTDSSTASPLAEQQDQQPPQQKDQQQQQDQQDGDGDNDQKENQPEPKPQSDITSSSVQQQGDQNVSQEQKSSVPADNLVNEIGDQTGKGKANEQQQQQQQDQQQSSSPSQFPPPPGSAGLTDQSTKTSGSAADNNSKDSEGWSILSISAIVGSGIVVIALLIVGYLKFMRTSEEESVDL